MNEIVRKMISSQALLFLYMLCGFILNKAHILRRDNRNVMVLLLMNVAIPMMILDAFSGASIRQEIRSSLIIMAASVGCALLCGLAGLFLWKNKPEERRKILEYATMFSNSGSAGLPVVSLVFGTHGVFLASMYLILPRILQWTLGLSLFIKPQKGSVIKNVLLNPIVVAVYIGLVLTFGSWEIPGVLGTAVNTLGSMSAPLSMILIGGTLAEMELRMFADKDVLLISAIRLLILPVACAALMRAVGINMTVCLIGTALISMPVASNTATVTERYGGDLHFASACVSVSTLLSCLTVPFVTWLVQLFQ